MNKEYMITSLCFANFQGVSYIRHLWPRVIKSIQKLLLFYAGWTQKGNMKSIIPVVAYHWVLLYHCSSMTDLIEHLLEVFWDERNIFCSFSNSCSTFRLRLPVCQVQQNMAARSNTGRVVLMYRRRHPGRLKKFLYEMYVTWKGGSDTFAWILVSLITFLQKLTGSLIHYLKALQSLIHSE